MIDLPTKQKKPNAVLDQYYAEQLSRTEEYLKLEDPVVLAAEANPEVSGKLASVFEPASCQDWSGFAADLAVWVVIIGCLIALTRVVFFGLFRGEN